MNIKKSLFLKRIFSTIVLLSFLVISFSSCSKAESKAVLTYGDKSISVAMYQCYLSKNKESVVETYKSYFQTYPDYFKDVFGFLPDGTEEYWEEKFWKEYLPEVKMTAEEYLKESTLRACMEYLVYEKIASDYKYPGLPKEITEQFDTLKSQNISKYGSYEAWNVATIGQYGITADELTNLSYVSVYGTVLPQFIFGEKGEKISDEKSIEALSESVQFKYSVYYYKKDVEEDTDNSNNSDNAKDKNVPETSENSNNSKNEDSSDNSENENVSDDSESSKEEDTTEDYNKHRKELMYANYDSVIKGEKTFDDVLKDSDDFAFIVDKSPNGVILTKKDFKDYFSSDKTNFEIGEIFIEENESGIFLIQVVELTKDYIDAKKSSLVNSMFDDILEKYFEGITVNNDVLKSISI